MQKPKGCYLYAYLRARDSKDGNWLAQTPYYIGKGKGRRAWQVHRRVHRPKDPNNIVILLDGQTREDALDLEIQLIKQFGRKNLGTGCLHNRTDGGDGASGAKPSEATRAKLSLARKGKPGSNLGKKFPPEFGHKISQARLGTPPWNRGREWPPEVRRKISKALIGKTQSAATCLKKRERMLGEKNHQYGKPGPMLGKQHPPAVREKISTANKGHQNNLGAKYAGSSSPYYGVCWRESRKTWRVFIQLQGKLKDIGSSRNPVIAAQLYDRYVVANGLDRPLNFPQADFSKAGS